MTTFKLKPVPPHPGPKPPWWRPAGRRWWRNMMNARQIAKAWNFNFLYGGAHHIVPPQQGKHVVNGTMSPIDDYDKMFIAPRERS